MKIYFRHDMSFTNKKVKSHQNLKVNTTKKKLKLKKNISRGVASRNNCIKFDVDWKLFRHRNDETFSAIHTKW